LLGQLSSAFPEQSGPTKMMRGEVSTVRGVWYAPVMLVLLMALSSAFVIPPGHLTGDRTFGPVDISWTATVGADGDVWFINAPVVLGFTVTQTYRLSLTQTNVTVNLTNTPQGSSVRGWLAFRTAEAWGVGGLYSNLTYCAAGECFDYSGSIVDFDARPQNTSTNRAFGELVLGYIASDTPPNLPLASNITVVAMLDTQTVGEIFLSESAPVQQFVFRLGLSTANGTLSFEYGSGVFGDLYYCSDPFNCNHAQLEVFFFNMK